MEPIKRRSSSAHGNKRVKTRDDMALLIILRYQLKHRIQEMHRGDCTRLSRLKYILLAIKTQRDPLYKALNFFISACRDTDKTCRHPALDRFNNSAETLLKKCECERKKKAQLPPYFIPIQAYSLQGLRSYAPHVQNLTLEIYVLMSNIFNTYAENRMRAAFGCRKMISWSRSYN